MKKKNQVHSSILFQNSTGSTQPLKKLILLNNLAPNSTKAVLKLNKALLVKKYNNTVPKQIYTNA